MIPSVFTVISTEFVLVGLLHSFLFQKKLLGDLAGKFGKYRAGNTIQAVICIVVYRIYIRILVVGQPFRDVVAALNHNNFGARKFLSSK